MGSVEDSKRRSTRVAVAPTKFARGLNGTGRTVRDEYEVLDVVDALTRVYATDAHLVSYVVGDGQWQPRVNKPGLYEAPLMPRTECFFCNVDNAGHAEWTDDSRAAARAQEAAIEQLATAGIYDTAHGRRIVQPIATPLAVDVAESHLHRWLRQLEADGLAVDWKCARWNHQFRLPNVNRAHDDFRSPYIALDGMRAIELAPLSCDARAIEWTRELPDVWHAKVARIAEAVRGVESEWHSLFLVLAGALLTRGAPPEHVPALCRAIALATNADTLLSDRETAGRTIVLRKRAGQTVKGHAELRRCYPTVADAVDAAFATGANARARALALEAANAPAPSPLAETTIALERAIRDAPDGLSMISAECGLGKTQAAIRVAVERAQKQHSSGAGVRAPTQSKTSISVDKHTLAIQIMGDVRKTGTPVKRLFGPLSLLRRDGTPECRYHAAATPLVEGGQSLKLIFCEPRGAPPCAHFEECRARAGFEGDEDARVVVGPHALLPAARAEAGTTGLLVIDEPPALLETVSFTLAELDATIEARTMFESRYAAAMLPALRAARAWVAAASDLDRVLTLKDAVCEAATTVDALELSYACMAAREAPSGDAGADALLCVANALIGSPKSFAPPIERTFAHAARTDVAVARQLGAASKVLKALRFALTTEERVAARVDDRHEERTLFLTHARGELVDAVRREGATVILDASADLLAPLFEKVLAYPPRVLRFTADDGAPIARTHLQTGKATRSKWLVGGQLVIDSGVVGALERVLAWAAEDPECKTLGLVTFRPLALAITIASREGEIGGSDREAWTKTGQRAEDLEKVVTLIRRALATWDGTLTIGHYGAVRGLDTMKDVDAMATLGDPWLPLDIVRHDVAFLDLEEPWKVRLEGLCRAELEQAHGRLRAVHRARPARAIHVGSVLPGGTGWRDGGVEFRQCVGGGVRTECTLPLEELRVIVAKLGGVRSSADAAGCWPSTMQRYISGERHVPAEKAVRLRMRAGRVIDGDAAAECQRAVPRGPY